MRKLHKNKILKKARILFQSLIYIPLDTVIVCSICLVFLLCIFIYIKTHEVFSANFADNVLRPVIGNQATIAMEAAFFKMEDSFNHIYYTFKKPQSVVFNSKQLPQKSSQMQLVKNSMFSNSPITSLRFFTPLPGEGIWTPVDTTSSGSGLMLKTFVRPDPQRDYASVALVKINLRKVTLGIVAGTWEPGEQAHRGPGKVPDDVQQSNLLIAAFNGGFQKKDGNYGMIVGDTTYLPLQKNLATIVLYKNEIPKIVNYMGQNLGKNIIAIRQNGMMIIQNGKIVPSPNENSLLLWGRTTTNSMYTWRSGIGITTDNNLVYAVGPSLVPETLAKALQAAGAINAMQLDINPVWVRFVVYSAFGNGRYASQSLLADMVNGGSSYLQGYQKDFFYVYKTP